MATWLDNPKCSFKPIIGELIPDPSLKNIFGKLYQKDKYMDHQIIFQDHRQTICMNVHKIPLILSSKYFKKTWKFKGQPVPNPLLIIVDDALIAKQIIEGFYGIDHHYETSRDILMRMLIRDFFFLTNDYRYILGLKIGPEDYDLLFKVINLFKANADLARLLNRTFFTESRVTNSILQESGLELSSSMVQYMVDQDHRYEFIIQDGNNNILLWNTFQEKYLVMIEDTKTNKIIEVVCSMDNSIIVLGREIHFYNGKIVEIWDVRTGSILNSFTYDSMSSMIICLSPDLSKLIIKTELHRITIYDINEIKSSTFPSLDIDFPFEHLVFVSGLSFSPCGKQFIVLHGFMIYVYDSKNLELVKKIELETTNWFDATFSPDGLQFACMRYCVFTILSAITFELLFELDMKLVGVSAFCYSPNSQYIVTGCNENNIRIWDATKGEILHTIEMNSPIKCINWPDDKYIIIAFDNGLIKILDMNTYTIIREEKVSEKISWMAVHPYQSLC